MASKERMLKRLHARLSRALAERYEVRVYGQTDFHNVTKWIDRGPLSGSRKTNMSYNFSDTGVFGIAKLVNVICH